MGNAQPCSPGTEIETLDECTDALTWSVDLGIQGWQTRFSVVQEGSWDYVPYQCSYQSNGDLAFYFGTEPHKNAEEFSNGNYQMICKKGKMSTIFVT